MTDSGGFLLYVNYKRCNHDIQQICFYISDFTVPYVLSNELKYPYPYP